MPYKTDKVSCVLVRTFLSECKVRKVEKILEDLKEPSLPKERKKMKIRTDYLVEVLAEVKKV